MAVGVPDAFAVRRELVNLKKLFLNCYQLAVGEEQRLRQLSTFFFCDMVRPQGKAGFLVLKQCLSSLTLPFLVAVGRHPPLRPGAQAVR